MTRATAFLRTVVKLFSYFFSAVEFLHFHPGFHNESMVEKFGEKPLEFIFAAGRANILVGIQRLDGFSYDEIGIVHRAVMNYDGFFALLYSAIEKFGL